MEPRSDFNVTDQATYQTIAANGMTYDADKNVFITEAGGEVSPLLLGISDDRNNFV